MFWGGSVALEMSFVGLSPGAELGLLWLLSDFRLTTCRNESGIEYVWRGSKS